MANQKGSRIDVQRLSARDMDIMTLDTNKIVKKYKITKGAVYNRRNSINKRLAAAGLTLEQLGDGIEEKETEKELKPDAQKEVDTKQKENTIRDVAVIDKNIPVVMKPIEITFDNFSIKLNGVPKRISVNPETHAIEIDL